MQKIKFRAKLTEFFVLTIAFITLFGLVAATSSNPIYMQNGNITTTGTLTTSNINATNYYLLNQTLGFVEPATFIIDSSAGTYHMWYGANSTLAYSSTNASKISNFVIGNCSGGETIYVKEGYYPLNGSILSQGKNNIHLVISKGATLALSGVVNNPVILPTSVSGWIIDGGGTIDGNRSAQTVQDAGSYGCDGINSFQCSNMIFRDLTIQNVFRTGISFAVNYNSSVLNCNFDNNNWNGFTDYESQYTKCNFNIIEDFAEVGISVGGAYGQYLGNTILNATAITAQPHSGANAHWGIGLENYLNTTGNDVADNQISIAVYGIWIDTGCSWNKIHDNTITQWNWNASDAYKPAIVCYGYSNQIYDNQMYNGLNGNAHGIGLSSNGYNNAVRGNQISAGEYGIEVSGNNTRILFNTTNKKLVINSGCYNATVSENDFSQCGTGNTNSGTGTQVGYNTWYDDTYTNSFK